ncbi:preprotein translocase subunit : [Tuwongella immobilis]|uniref:Preprotein translocase subunit n=1 Tax=Tuwongella immobilis TaxID=692036 RepID=A0A6C2YJM8_9BACT|nr:preprotein translocase subunit : [Tuwongella immobilis]VTR99421.1 preprotein translocase subunit : [Tuwongella immobilis]
MSIVPGIILNDIVGLPIGIGDVLLVPARFDFCADVEGTTEYCAGSFGPDLPRLRSLFNCYDLHDETVLHYWLRARIPSAFHLRPATGGNQGRHDLLEFPFLAVVHSRSTATLTALPFICADGYRGPGLIFPKTGFDTSAKQRVAAAFWGVLLESPEDIAPFEEWVYDDESGLQKVYCGRDLLCICDLQEWDENRGRYDPHLAAFAGELFACPDCGGSGVEDVLTFREDCATCDGQGQVSW